MRDVLVAEARLADPGLALERDDTTVLRARSVCSRELLPLAVPPDQHARRQRLQQRRRRARGREPSLVHRLVELGRLGQRAHAQLAVEDADALAVLPQRLGAIAGGGVELDHAAVGGLIEWIESQPAARMGYRLVEAAGGGERGDEPIERRGELAAQLGGHQPLPAVELDAIAQREAGEQIVAMQRDRARERSDLVRSAHGCREECPEARDVDVGIRGSERDGRPVDAQPVSPHRRLQRRQRPAECGPRPVVVVLGPEEPGQTVAAVGVAGDREEGKQRDRLACVDAQRRAIDLDARSAQERDSQRHMRKLPTRAQRRPHGRSGS